MPVRIMALWLSLGLACFGSETQRPAAKPEASPQTSAPELLTPAAQSFGEKDGLPHLNINELVPDTQGRIWAATQGGVAVYNGQGWTPIPLPKECHSTYVRCVLPARDGALWVGTQDDGLWELRRGVWTKHDGVMGLSASRINSIAEVPGPETHPIIVAGTSSGGVQVLRGPRWEPLPGVSHRWVWRMRWDPQAPQRLWIATRNGVCLWDAGGPWAARPTCLGAQGVEISDVAWTQEPGGGRQTWLSVWGQGLAKEKGDLLVFEETEKGLRSRNLTCVTVGPGPEGLETLWVASYGRGFFWRDRTGRWRETEFQQGSHSRAVYWILSRPGHRPALWVGFHAAGVLAIDLDGWKNVALPFPESHLTASALAVMDEKGTPHYWIATSLGLVEWTGLGWRIHTKADGLPVDRVESLAPTRAFGAPGLLVSTLQGLALWQGGRWRPIHQPGPSWRSAIQILETEVDGHPGFWIGGTNWLAKYVQGKWTSITEADGDMHMLVYALKETQEPGGGKTLWVGTRGRGLFRYEAGAWTGVGSKKGFHHPSVYALQTTPRPGGHYRLWAGTLGGGLGWWDSDRPDAPWKWLSGDTIPALPSNAIVAIIRDRNGALFLSTHKGVQSLKMPPGAEDQPERWVLSPYSLADGLPSQICSDRAAMADPQGRIWIGTLLGATVFDPDARPPQEQPAAVSLDRAWIGNQEVPQEPQYWLDHRQRQIAFSFSLPIYHGVQEQRFQTQLLPLEAHPTAWQSLRRRELAGLAPGDYTLRIWGKDHLERVSGPLELQIHLATPPWRRPWALGIYALIGATLFFWVIRWRGRTLAERNRVLEAMVQEALAALERQKEQLAELRHREPR